MSYFIVLHRNTSFWGYLITDKIINIIVIRTFTEGSGSNSCNERLAIFVRFIFRGPTEFWRIGTIPLLLLPISLKRVNTYLEFLLGSWSLTDELAKCNKGEDWVPVKQSFLFHGQWSQVLAELPCQSMSPSVQNHNYQLNIIYLPCTTEIV